MNLTLLIAMVLRHVLFIVQTLISLVTVTTYFNLGNIN